MQFAFCQKIRQYDVIMTSNSVNMSIKVSSEMLEKKGNIILCYFGPRIMSSFEVIEGWEGRRGKGGGA